MNHLAFIFLICVNEKSTHLENENKLQGFYLIFQLKILQIGQMITNWCANWAAILQTKLGAANEELAKLRASEDSSPRP